MFIYEGCYPFNQNQETHRYRWHFEDPSRPEHKVVEEMVVDYEDGKVIIVRCESKDLNYSAILGRYDEAHNKISPFHESGAIRKAIAQKIADIAGLDGLVDI
jgi:hypothetical protein